MRVIDMEDITEAMNDQTRFVLHCEEVYRDKISTAAAKILHNKNERPIVCLTGPSGSGKTTTAMRLKAYLENMGVPVGLVGVYRGATGIDSWTPPEGTRSKKSTGSFMRREKVLMAVEISILLVAKSNR